MITSLLTSLLRVTLFWYTAAMLVLFLGDPAWAEAAYTRLMDYPWIPDLELHGLATAPSVQWQLLAFWTAPMALLWLTSLGIGVLVAEIECQLSLHTQRKHLKPTGEYWGVGVDQRSLGQLPRATTPALVGQEVTLGGPGNAKRDNAARVELRGVMKDVIKMLTPVERQLAEELLQLLLQAPDHFAGLGHGVGLLEHTLNVVTEAATKVTPEFRMPFLAALSHDIGKLVTFQPDGQGGWKKKGLHSRESARILATMPAFQELPELHQRALLLAVKYDHAPSKMPEIRGDREACTMAMRIISSLAMADRKATADEKERNLERLQPEDLLWKDFIDFLREAPVVQRGKKGAANQVNNPPDSPYLYLYEAPWRDAAVRRLPGEVAAALDLTRRDAGKMAKYTRYLVERLRKEGLLLETYSTKDENGNPVEMTVSDTNPLWDIQSGTGEKAVVLRGILVLNAAELWKKLNYRISVKSPFPVQILAPNADTAGKVNDTPRANREEPRTPDVSDGLKLGDVENPETMNALGLTEESAVDAPKATKPKTRARGGFKPAVSSTVEDSVLGLAPSSIKKPVAPAVSAPIVAAVPPEPAPVVDDANLTEQELQELAEMAAELAAATSGESEPAEELATSTAADNAMAYLALTSAAAADTTTEPVASDEASSEELNTPAKVSSEPLASTEATKKMMPQRAPEQKRKVDAAKPNQSPEGSATATAGSLTKPPVKKTEAEGETSDAEGLSRAERRMGLAVADAAAVEKYPNLAVGDKYYTAESPSVKEGRTKLGGRYKGDQPVSPDSGPRRMRRRLTS